MSNWRDPEKWESLLTEAGCPICQRGTPPDAIAQLEASWVEMPEEAPMRGYVFVVARRHVIELHELTDHEAAALMRDLRRVARAVTSIVHPVKLNVEQHGNTIPHLHLHVFPRYRGDPFEGKPIDPRAVTEAVYAPGELASLRAAVARAIEGQMTNAAFRRPTTDAEWAAYHAIRKRVLFDLRGQGDAYDADHADEHRPEHHPFVLWDDGVPVGVIRIDVHGKLAMFRRVAIRDDLQRRGHGRRLLEAAERFASEQGCTRVESHVDPFAIEFYERCGFARVAPTAGNVAMLMTKALR